MGEMLKGYVGCGKWDQTIVLWVGVACCGICCIISLEICEVEDKANSLQKMIVISHTANI